MIQEVMLFLSSLSLGIFLGAQVTEALLFVPNWKSLKADDFYDFYESYGKKIHVFFAPLTIIATITPLLSVLYNFMYEDENQVFFGLMGLCTLAFFSTYFLYFKKANKYFFGRSLSKKNLQSELKKWENWHWFRVGFELIAFGLSLFLLMTI